MGYKFLDHTGDIGMIVWADDLKTLYAQAATALFDIITDIDRVEQTEERQITVDGAGNEELLVAWLNELLYLHEVERLLFHDFTIATLGEKFLRGTVRGEAFRDDYHIIKTTIKAATYHQLQVRNENGRWWAKVILDL